MLEASIIDQLKNAFSQLEGEVSMLISPSDHPKQEELLTLLKELASTSDKIRCVMDEESSAHPRFEIEHKGKKTGIIFSGIPGGHEFTSLVLAILNSDGRGQMPDQGIVDRILMLKGPIRLSTYISLSCEVCPEVVQALNLMASLRDDFQHEMKDGAFFQDEVEKKNIQGVPSVMDGDQLVHSGKADLSQLIRKLGEHFGSQSTNSKAKDLGKVDVAIIGAGPAGASASIYCARKGMKTTVVAERFGGQVKDTLGIENLISVPYIEGPKLTEQLHKHMLDYDITLLEHRRVEKVEVKEGEGQVIHFDSGEFLQSRALIVTTGAKWKELGIPGEKEYLGRGVAFCPHCDGPYYKGKDVAVVGGGNSGVEAAIDLSGIVKSVTLMEFLPELKADSVLVKKLKSLANVKIITNAAAKAVKGDDQKVVSLSYTDRSSEKELNIALDGVFVQIGLAPNSDFIKNLVETNRMGEIVVDAKGRTSCKGIYAAGDVTDVAYKQIIIAMGEGAKAALTAHQEQ